MIEKSEMLERVQAGQRARELFAMMADETHPHFWRTLADHVVAKIGKVIAEPEIEVPAMNDAQAHEFEQHAMPFGKHQGQRIVDLETNYLAHLTDPSPFLLQTKRYVAWRLKRFGE